MSASCVTSSAPCVTSEQFIAGVKDEPFVAPQDFPVGAKLFGKFLLAPRSQLGVGQFLQSLLRAGDRIAQGVYHGIQPNEHIVDAWAR